MRGTACATSKPPFLADRPLRYFRTLQIAKVMCPNPGCGKFCEIQSVSEHVKTCNSEYGLWTREARDKARERNQWQSANPAAVVPAGRYEEADSGPEDDEVDA